MALKVMKVHDVAKLFPLPPAKELKDLRSDIEANGIIMPILVNKKRDTILDGRTRWMIANELKLKDVPMQEFEGKDEDIPSEILSRNVFRRHLNDDQRISLLAKVLAPKLEEEAAARKTKKGSFGAANSGEKGSVAAHLAKEAKVSQHKAEQALKAGKAGQLDAVISGKTKLRKAASGAPSKKRTPPKERTFEDEVWIWWDRAMKKWDVTQHRRVKEIVRGFLDNKPTDKKK